LGICHNRRLSGGGEMKELVRVEYNWYATNENGEEYQFFEVGKNCQRIEVRYAMGEGDHVRVTVTVNQDESHVIFHPNRLIFKEVVK